MVNDPEKLYPTEYPETGNTARHFSLVRSTLTTFLLTVALAALSAYFDKAHGKNLFFVAAGGLFLAVATIVCFSFSYRTSKKELLYRHLGDWAHGVRGTYPKKPQWFDVVPRMFLDPMNWCLLLIVAGIGFGFTKYSGVSFMSVLPTSLRFNPGTVLLFSGILALAVAALLSLPLRRVGPLLGLACLGAILCVCGVALLKRTGSSTPRTNETMLNMGRLGSIGPFTSDSCQTIEAHAFGTLDSLKAWIEEAGGQEGLAGLILVGAADGRELGPHSTTRYGSNMGLAQMRAVWVRDSLVATGACLAGMGDRVLVLSRGPGLVTVGKDPKSVRRDRCVEAYGCWKDVPPGSANVSR